MLFYLLLLSFSLISMVIDFCTCRAIQVRFITTFLTAISIQMITVKKANRTQRTMSCCHLCYKTMSSSAVNELEKHFLPFHQNSKWHEEVWLKCTLYCEWLCIVRDGFVFRGHYVKDDTYWNLITDCVLMFFSLKITNPKKAKIRKQKSGYCNVAPPFNLTGVVSKMFSGLIRF